MHPQQELALSNDNSPLPDFPVITRFCIKDTTFLVVALQDYEQHQNLLHQQIDHSAPFLCLGQFSCEGKDYVIISAQQGLEAVDANRISLLTARELQIASLVALGRSNKQVSTQLHISEWTVSAHLRRIFIKLSVDSRAAMVYKCASLIEHLQQFQDSQN